MNNNIDYDKIKNIISEETKELIDLFAKLNSIDESNKSVSNSIFELSNKIDKLCDSIDTLSKKIDETAYIQCNKCIDEEISIFSFNIKYKKLISFIFILVVLIFGYIVGVIDLDITKGIFSNVIL